MQDKIKSYVPKAVKYLNSLQDIQVAGQLVFVIIVLLVSWSGVKAIQTNYGLQKQISQLRQETELQQLKNNNLKLQNDYYKSNQYLELSARQNFGLAQPGEKEIIVPESVALSNTIDTPAIKQKTIVPDNRSSFEKHLDAWLKFFLHK